MSLFRSRRSRTVAAVVAAVSTASLVVLPTGAIAVVEQPPAPDLTAASDSGTSDSDNITKAATLTFTSGRTVPEGQEIELLRGEMVVDREASAATPLSDAPGEGIFAYSTRLVTIVGGTPVPVPSSDSPGLEVTVDRTAPTALAATPDLQAGSDSGTSSTDNVTNKTSRTFDVTLATGSAALATGDRLELLRGGTSVAVATASTAPQALVDPTVTQGTESISARVIDLAGNTPTAASTALPVTVDTVAQPPVLALAAASDLGRSNSDGITTTLVQGSSPASYATSLSITVTGEAGSTLSAFTRKINSAAAAAQTLTVTTIPGTYPAAGTATQTNAISALASLAPTQGSYLYSVVQTDIAGNASQAGTYTATVDVTPPAPAVVTLDSSTDTGPSNTDAVTRWDSSATTAGGLQTLKVNVTGEPLARVELRRNGTLVTAPTTPLDLPAAVAPATTSSVQYSEPGPFAFTAIQGYTAELIDIAGNSSVGAAGVRVDLDNPAVPNKLDLETASDTGSSDADDITNDTTPTFIVSGVEDDATVYLYRCNGAAACTTTTRGTQGPGILATRVGNGPITAPVTPENCSVCPGGAPANTSWRFTVTQRDLSGRFSGGQVSAAVAEGAGMSVNINVVIDTTAEAVPAAPELLSSSQTGPGAGPSKTSEVSPTFNVAKGTGRVELLRDGVVVGRSVGAGEITDPGPLANGTYKYTTRSIDTAGNISAASAPTTVTIANGTGYWLLGRDGGVFSFGDADFFGSTGDLKLNAPVMSMTTTPKKDGYWLLARDGGVFSFGGADFFGSTGDQKLNSPIVGMVSTPSGKGYWLFAEDGGVFAFGDAPFHGAPASESPKSPVVAMLATRDGRGYWLVTKTGKVYAYGSATAMSGVDSLTLNFPIVGMAATPSGGGLWLVATDGGIFGLGDAVFHGSAGDIRLNSPIIGMLALADGSGYLLIASDGGVFTFGKAEFLGSTGGQKLNAPIVGIAGA